MNYNLLSTVRGGQNYSIISRNSTSTGDYGLNSTCEGGVTWQHL